MKKLKVILVLLLASIILLSMAACETDDVDANDNGDDAVSEAEKNNDAASGVKKNNGGETTSVETEPEKLTLDNAEVRLIYHDDKYLAVLYHGPDDDITMAFGANAGSTLKGDMLHSYSRLQPNWRIVLVTKMPAGYSLDEINLSVTDRSVEGNPKRTFSDFESTKPVTREELEGLGLTYLEDIPFIIKVYAPAYSKRDIEIMVFFTGLFEYNGINVDTWPFTPESFQTFAGDGTPLGDYFDGYDLEYKTQDGRQYIYVVLNVVDGNKSESRNKALCDEILECKPYMVFTAKDGSTVTIPLSPNVKNSN